MIDIEKAIDDAQRIPEDRYPMWRHENGKRILRAAEFYIVFCGVPSLPQECVDAAIRKKLVGVCENVVRAGEELDFQDLRVTMRRRDVVLHHTHGMVPSLGDPEACVVTLGVPVLQHVGRYSVTAFTDRGWSLRLATHDEWFGRKDS